MDTNDSADETAQEAPGPRPMRPLHPNQKWVLRIRTGLASLALLVIAQTLDLGPLRATPVPSGLVPAALALLGAAAILLLPWRRYRAWGYCEEEDELHIRHGLLVRMRTIVPFGRVQHIDVAHGPIERAFGLATLILHTAGTRGAAVSLPGLLHADAEAIRDRIRAKIRQDLV